MAKLYYKFGTMNSSKSANLLMTMHNYQNTNKSVTLIQSNKNTRDNGKIVSRIGIKADAIQIDDKDNLYEMFKSFTGIDAILVDEVQFMTIQHIIQLSQIVDYLDIDVICYGLKSDFLGNLFPSISKLISIADNISEIKQVCTYCNSKAIMNLKIENGQAIYSGDNISIGDTNRNKSSYYVAVCRKHYFKPTIKKENLKGKGEQWC